MQILAVNSHLQKLISIAGKRESMLAWLHQKGSTKTTFSNVRGKCLAQWPSPSWSMPNIQFPFMYHVLLLLCHIFNVLLVKRLYNNGDVSTPYDFFQGREPNTNHFRVFGCPLTTWNLTTTSSSSGKQTEHRIRGIFTGFGSTQIVYYVFHAPSSHQLYISGEVLFDELFNGTIAAT